MSDGILDRLDRDPGGARQYVATLIVAGGASRAEVAEALARKYHIAPPTGRSVTQWKNHDPELRDLIAQMEAAKRDVKPGDDPADLLPRKVNRALAVADLLHVLDEFPAFERLFHREAARRKSAPGSAADTASAWGSPLPDEATIADGDRREDLLALIESEGMTDEEFEQDCIRRLGDYEEHLPSPSPEAP
jgi:hypothetical protein